MRQHTANTVPAARTQDLVVTESRTDVLVYDTASHHIHHLDQMCTAIWWLCDGRRSVGDIVQAVTSELGTTAVSGASVRAALGKLETTGLLATGFDPWIALAGQTRRALPNQVVVQ